MVQNANAKRVNRPLPKSSRERLLLSEDLLQFWQDRAPKALDPSGLRAMFALRAIRMQLSEAMATLFEPFGLTSAKYMYLGVLYVADKQRLTLNEISARVYTTSASVTRMIGALQNEGLVARTENPRDGRSAIITLTRRGSKLIEQVTPVHLRCLAEILGPISTSDRATLLRILLQLGASLDSTA
jgi:DNA-binding MarR family transcriptional regulator